MIKLLRFFDILNSFKSSKIFLLGPIQFFSHLRLIPLPTTHLCSFQGQTLNFCNKIAVITKITKRTRKWDIKVTQYACGDYDSSGWPGCLQYYTATAAKIQKYDSKSDIVNIFKQYRIHGNRTPLLIRTP